jgi:hypothetical protein
VRLHVCMCACVFACVHVCMCVCALVPAGWRVLTGFNGRRNPGTQRQRRGGKGGWGGEEGERSRQVENQGRGGRCSEEQGVEG